MTHPDKFKPGEFGQEIDDFESKAQAMKRKSFWLIITAWTFGVYSLRLYEKYGASVITYCLSGLALLILLPVPFFLWKEFRLGETLDQRHLERIDALFKNWMKLSK